MSHNLQSKLILASSSPQRANLLEELGIEFQIIVPQINEIHKKGERPEDFVQRIALEKAHAVTLPHQVIILGADTIVVIDDEILGKPANAITATRHLGLLSGRKHEVLTGYAIVLGDGTIFCKGYDRSRVTMKVIIEEEIMEYVASGEPLDKAGAYAVQGLASRFIEKIEGSRSNVIGLPVETLTPWLKKLGLIK